MIEGASKVDGCLLGAVEVVTCRVFWGVVRLISSRTTVVLLCEPE